MVEPTQDEQDPREVNIPRALFKQIQHAAIDADVTVLRWIDTAIKERLDSLRLEREKPPASS